MHTNAMVGQSGMGNLGEVALRHMTSGTIVNRSALLFRKPTACIGMTRKAFGPKEGGTRGGGNRDVRVMTRNARQPSIAGFITATQFHRGAVGQ